MTSRGRRLEKQVSRDCPGSNVAVGPRTYRITKQAVANGHSLDCQKLALPAHEPGGSRLAVASQLEKIGLASDDCLIEPEFIGAGIADGLKLIEPALLVLRQANAGRTAALGMVSGRHA